jgi:hypothetical protein
LTEAGLAIVEQQFVPEGDGGHALFWARQPGDRLDHAPPLVQAAATQPAYADGHAERR